jgi:hypothetical protein
MTTEKINKANPLTLESIDSSLYELFERQLSLFSMPNNWLGDYCCESDNLVSEKLPFDFDTEYKGTNHHYLTDVTDQLRRCDNGDRVFSSPLTDRGDTKYPNQTINQTQQRTISEVAENTTYNVQPTSEGKWGGFDGGVEIGFEVQWNKEQFNALLEVLAEGRQQAESHDEKTPVYAQIGGRPFIIKPTGAKAGLYYKFILEGCGINVYIHHKPPKNRQGIRVRYQFESLIRFDLYSLHEKLREWLESLGLTITKETVSRVDMQVMTLRKTHDYLKLIINNHAITRAQKDIFSS